MATQRSDVQRKMAPRATPARLTDPSPFSRTGSERPVTPEQIAVAAYYKAMARGFTPGQEMEDWLAAESELTRERSSN